jgi:hypothetical protein
MTLQEFIKNIEEQLGREPLPKNMIEKASYRLSQPIDDIKYDNLDSKLASIFYPSITLTANLFDKSAWPDGPWKDEPDRVLWTDEKTGLPCLAKRNKEMGIWCGYVGIGKDHPFHGYDQLSACDMLPEGVHWGITYAAECDGNPETGICHLSNDEDHVWWFGFDCAHAGDIVPTSSHAVRSVCSEADWKYRDLAYVQAECEKLAAQLFAAANV